MTNLLIFFYHSIQSPPFLLYVIIISLGVKTYFLTSLIPRGLYSQRFYKPWIFLLGTLIGSMFGDLAWSIKLMREIIWPSTSYSVVTFFIRLAWCFLIWQYQSLALFIPSLTQKKFKLSYFQKISLCTSALLSLYFFYLAFFEKSLITEHERELAKQFIANVPFEIRVMRCVPFYLLFALILPGLSLSLWHIWQNRLPTILKKQLKIFIVCLICPYLFIEFLQAASIIFVEMKPYLYPIVSISTLLLSYTIYYCLKRVIGLRFLNFHNHVHSHPKMHFIGQFKHVLEQLSHATSIYELGHITQTFFKESFNLPLNATHLYFREQQTTTTTHPETYNSQETSIYRMAEQFISPHAHEIIDYITQAKILIYDDIAFNHFYEETKQSKIIMTFLESIDADIFLPVYNQQKIIAYIIVKRSTRLQECFSKEERDEMLVFANYLGNIINLIQHRNIDSLIQQEKKLKEDVYYTHQEIHLFKESIRSFLYNKKQKAIGIIFYKNRKFIFGNQAAKELVNININQQEGHPLTKAIKDIAHKVTEYKSPQTTITSNSDGERLVLSCVPHLEQNCVLITVSYPDISDIISKNAHRLYNPTDWDYLLYLETTHAGKLINQLIPSEQEAFLNIKINILKVGLSKNTVFLRLSEDDAEPIVKLLHHISLRETLQIIDVQTKETNATIATKLFGINPTLNTKNPPIPLLEKLNDSGTLFINNVHLLDLETQHYLAEFIRYGFFRIFKSDQKIASNARIICAVHDNIQHLLQHDMFSKSLYHEIKNNILTIPPLNSFSEHDLNCLADKIAEQISQTHALKSLLTLTPKEKKGLVQKHTKSLRAFRQKIRQLVIQKSKKSSSYSNSGPNQNSIITDPELEDIKNLGRKALKDHASMIILWEKFKNQNEIARFLGVNRSSVNRRFKEYNLR